MKFSDLANIMFFVIALTLAFYGVQSMMTGQNIFGVVLFVLAIAVALFAIWRMKNTSNKK